MANSKRKCANCKDYFKPEREFPGPSAWCSSKCGAALALSRLPAQRKKAQRQDRAEKRRRMDAIKPRAKWLKEAQAAFNGYIRARDAGMPCISCGNLPEQKYGGTMDAGHYRSTGSCPELRFEPLNCWAQCVKCNRHLSGNSVDYRIGLVKRIGLEKVEWLESNHEAKHYKVDDLRAIREQYKELKREAGKAS